MKNKIGYLATLLDGIFASQAYEIYNIGNYSDHYYTDSGSSKTRKRAQLTKKQKKARLSSKITKQSRKRNFK